MPLCAQTGVKSNSGTFSFKTIMPSLQHVWSHSVAMFYETHVPTLPPTCLCRYLASILSTTWVVVRNIVHWAQPKGITMPWTLWGTCLINNRKALYKKHQLFILVYIPDHLMQKLTAENHFMFTLSRIVYVSLLQSNNFYDGLRILLGINTLACSM